jgi:hypothetical protein
MKTNITVRQLRKLNPWIKTDKQAEDIIRNINTRPSISLSQLLRQSGKTGKNKGREKSRNKEQTTQADRGRKGLK